MAKQRKTTAQCPHREGKSRGFCPDCETTPAFWKRVRERVEAFKRRAPSWLLREAAAPKPAARIDPNTKAKTE